MVTETLQDNFLRNKKCHHADNTLTLLQRTHPGMGYSSQFPHTGLVQRDYTVMVCNSRDINFGLLSEVVSYDCVPVLKRHAALCAGWKAIAEDLCADRCTDNRRISCHLLRAGECFSSTTTTHVVPRPSQYVGGPGSCANNNVRTNKSLFSGWCRIREQSRGTGT